MLKIIPAILEQDLVEFKRKLAVASGFAQTIQIDIADGKFVPNKTLEVAQVAQYAQNAQIGVEWHLMVVEPLGLLDVLKSQTVIFHYEAVSDPSQTIEVIKSKGHQVGLVLNPGTPVEVVDRLVDKIAMVTVMGVDPGFQGSPFVPSSLKKIVQVKTRYPNLMVELDGGVNANNFTAVIKSGVDQVVIGSGLWKTAQPAREFAKLTQLAKQLL